MGEEVQLTRASREILSRLYPNGIDVALGQAMRDVQDALGLGRLMKAAVEEATVDGKVRWEIAAVLVMAWMRGQSEHADR